MKNNEVTLDDLAQMMERGFAAIAGDIADIREHMATKDEVAALRTELKTDIADLSAELDDTRAELRGKIDGINRRLDTDAMIRSDLKLPERLAAVERHLGLNREIRA